MAARRISPLYLALVLGTALVAGCGAGPYGYARDYAPLGEETPYYNSATDLSYQDVVRQADRYTDETLGWFGIVTGMEDDEGGRVRVSLSLRAHQDRHLCGDETAGSCRVTVSDRPIGPFVALLTVRPEDREGQNRLWAGSLVRVYGHAQPEVDPVVGPVIEAAYYRHWPHGTFVTTGSAGAMRR
jgi:hypothetical protein